MRVMLRMLGIGANEEARWQRWSAKRARLLEMIATRSERKTAHITGESITRYFRELLAERARSEGDDVISALAREAARAEFINTAEAADMLGVIMIAGNETTANLIGNGLWALMRHPEQMERLREEPERGARRDQRGPALRQPGADGFQNCEERGGERREDHPGRRRRDPADRIGKPRRGGIQRARSTRHRTQGTQACGVRARSAPVYRCRARAHGDERRHRERGGAIRADHARGARSPRWMQAEVGRKRSDAHHTKRVRARTDVEHRTAVGAAQGATVSRYRDRACLDMGGGAAISPTIHSVEKEIRDETEYRRNILCGNRSRRRLDPFKCGGDCFMRPHGGIQLLLRR